MATFVAVAELPKRAVDNPGQPKTISDLQPKRGPTNIVSRALEMTEVEMLFDANNIL